jgi:quercetin dioxygenase-like cupin family protein
MMARAGSLPAADGLVRRIFQALAKPEPQGDVAPETVPVCAMLPEVLFHASLEPPPLARLTAAVAALAPKLAWRRRPNAEKEGEAFLAGHANANVVGPEGLETRNDVLVGISLMAPGLRYPDHDHPPEEVYISLAGGEWKKGDEDWRAPGRGGLVHNPPGIVHAMRTKDEPLLAIWCLWAGS